MKKKSARLEPCCLPSSCVYAKAGDKPCRIAVDHRRDRKTGPAFPIAVLVCSTHRRCFTLYPLGHFPYGRVALAPVGPDGAPLYSCAEGQADCLAWGTTLFAAAFALVAGVAPLPADPKAWWATEAPDSLPFAAAVLGFVAHVADSVRQTVAETLGIASIVLRDAARDYQAAHGQLARANVLVATLGLLRPDRGLVNNILGSGALVGCWGRVERWDPGRKTACRRLFPGRGIPDG